MNASNFSEGQYARMRAHIEIGGNITRAESDAWDVVLHAATMAAMHSCVNQECDITAELV